MTPTVLNWYGLKKLGFDEESIGLSGNLLQDQIAIEALCLRIEHAEYEGGVGAFGHFKNYVDLLWNNADSGSMKRCVWNPWANRMFRKMLSVRELSIAGCASAGKCWESSTSILMYDGTTKPASEIVPGDQVMGDDSTPRTVQEVHRGHGRMLRVVPCQGEPWLCTPNHILVLKRTIAPGKAWRRMGEIVEVAAGDYNSQSVQFKHNHNQFCVGVDFPERELPLDPRVMGFWIGDGHIHSCRISIHDSEVEELKYLQEWAERSGHFLNRLHNPTCDACPAYYIGSQKGKEDHPVRTLWRECVVEGEKRIPREYLINSRENRMALLAGIIDTDGYASRTFFEIATKYAGLKDDIVFLARSLGFRVSAVLRMATCNGKKFPSWRISVCGDVSQIPTLRKKCKAKRLRNNSDCTGIRVEEAGEGDWVGFSVDGNHRLLLGDFTVTHNSDPAALYGIVRYTTDPTHTLVLMMSTTIQGAKRRVWKTLREYWESVNGLPGKPLWSSNEIRGLNYRGDGYGTSSGIFLLASEQSNEKAALDKIIGIKAPRTGEPGDSFEELMQQAEYADLRNHFDEETLRDLVPRLQNLSQDRIGRLILIIDEMTGMSESILNAVNTNLKPGNVGHFQIIGIGNPNLPYDPFGLFSKPKGGWDKVDLLNDMEWETETGGLCIRFNAEENPRITESNEKYSWMLRREEIEAFAQRYGTKSLFYHRMVLGTWCLDGDEVGVYSPADIEMSGAKERDVVWGYEAPIPVSFLDPAFTAGGDLVWATFGLLGRDFDGKMVLQITDNVTIKTDPTNTLLPVNYQIVKQWRQECEARKVRPQHAAYDRTGGGVPFGDIVTVAWSPMVTGVQFGGQASMRLVHGEKSPEGRPIRGCDRFDNKATEIWYGAHPLFRSGQIRGVSDDLAKELCSRQHSKKFGDGRKICIEGKRAYKEREGKSPDQSDSFLGLVDFCRDKHGLHPIEGDMVRQAQREMEGHAGSVWAELRKRARRLTNARNLKRS